MSNDQELPPLPDAILTDLKSVSRSEIVRDWMEAYARTCLAAQAEQLKAKDARITLLEQQLDTEGDVTKQVQRERDELRAQLQALREQEPIDYQQRFYIHADRGWGVWLECDKEKFEWIKSGALKDFEARALYAAPVPAQERKPLSMDEIKDKAAHLFSVSRDSRTATSFLEGVRFAETHHGIKEQS